VNLVHQTSSLSPTVTRWTCGAEAQPEDKASFDWKGVTCPDCLAGRPGYRWLVSEAHLERPVWVRMVEGSLEWWNTFDMELGWTLASEEEWGELREPVLSRAEATALREENEALRRRAQVQQGLLEGAAVLRDRVQLALLRAARDREEGGSLGQEICDLLSGR